MRLRERWHRRAAAPAAPGGPAPRSPGAAPDERLRRVAGLVDREMVSVVGTVRATTVAPPAKALALRAELADDTGTLALVWLGRHAIAGIEPGVSLRVHGRACVRPDGVMMYNPRYEILPATGIEEPTRP